MSRSPKIETQIRRHGAEAVSLRNITLSLLFGGWLSLLDEARDPDEDHSSYEGYDDGADHAAALPDSQHVEDPSAKKPAKDAKDDVHQDAVSAALHYLSGEPTRDESNHDPSQPSHCHCNPPKAARAGRQNSIWRRGKVQRAKKVTSL